MSKLLAVLILLFPAMLISCKQALETENKAVEITDVLFFPDLLEQIETVESINITQPGSGVNTSLIRIDESWYLQSPADVPANSLLIETILKAMATARILETKTTRADWYHYLGVGDIHMPEAKGTLIELRSASKRWQVIVGNSSTEQPGQYWRQAEQDTVVRVDQTLALPAQLLDWMDRLIIDVPAIGIESIEINSVAGASFKLQRADHQQELMLGSGEAQPQPVQLLLQGLYKLHYDAIRKADGSLEQAAQDIYKYQLFDGSTIVLSCTTDPEGSWCQLRVRASAIGENLELLKEQAAEMNMRLSPWSFHLSQKRTALFLDAQKILFEKAEEK